MNDAQRLQLQNMIAANNVEDNTDLIRQLKHSTVLKNDIDKLLQLKQTFAQDAELVHLNAMVECTFLFTYYTDIYNKIRKDEIDLNLLNQALDVLKRIEDGLMDQHEGAFEFGTLLKQMYVDSALKRAEKLDEEETKKKEMEAPKKTHLPITWAEFKKQKDNT